jgi:serine/threonine protein kinase
MMHLQTGTFLQGGKYKIEKVLGQGGFGITYLAAQELLNRKVCIKEFFFKEYCERDVATNHITLGTQSSRELVERFKVKFLKEARTISQLDQPNIIKIFDIFNENNTAYYVMEYIEGESLADIVNNKGSLSESAAVGYINQIALALNFIHQHSINHLDVKPANIMVRHSDNKAILIDFGLSKQYDSHGGQTSTTPVGISHGYAPMEQYNIGGVSTFSPQTDIYSLGATLYKLVTGHTPPQASQILNDGLPDFPTHLSWGVKNTILQAMQIRKKDRPQSIDEFLLCLTQTNDLQNKQTSPNQTPTIDEETKYIHQENLKDVNKEKKQTKKNSLGITLLLVALVLGVGIYFISNSSSDSVSQSDLMEQTLLSNTIENTNKETIKQDTEFKTKKYSINKTEGDFKYIVQMDYPISGNENLVLNIKEWIVESLLRKYNGSLDEPNKILETGYLDKKKEWDPMFASETQIAYNNIYKTKSIITYEEDSYGYEGGAHGFSSNSGVTFRVKDGRRFGWDMLVKEQALKNLIIEGLKKQYFEVNSDNDFFAAVMLEDTPNRQNFPFPETAPWITSKGVVFQYKEYEIASYAQGKPYCIIPLSQVQSFFTSSVKRMLE